MVERERELVHITVAIDKDYGRMGAAVWKAVHMKPALPLKTQEHATEWGLEQLQSWINRQVEFYLAPHLHPASLEDDHWVG